MAYLLLLITAAIWSFMTLRDRPFKEYMVIFFACVLLAIPAEVTTLRLLNVYAWYMRMLADPEADKIAASMVILSLNPLLGLLYARHCQHNPIMRALLASITLGLIEIMLVGTGFFVYHSWNPILTIGLFFVYFLIVWRITLIVAEIPVWMHLMGFTMWFGLILDMPLQGIWWLWHFDVRLFGDFVRDNRIVSFIPNLMILTPSAMAVSLVKAKPKLMWAILTVIILLLIEAATLSSGILIYDHWSLGWSAIKYCVIIFASEAYTRWMRNRGHQIRTR